MNRFVDIEHDELGTSRVIRSTLPVWLARGWRTTQPEPTSDPEVTSTPEVPSATAENSADEPVS